jgi:hypothetical protein
VAYHQIYAKPGVNLKVVKIYTSGDAVDDSAENQPVLKPNLNQSLFQHDSAFDWLYPEHIEAKSGRHWTPLTVAQKAAEFLAVPDARILDIGSGIGKFCLSGAYHHPETFFYGVEQRHELVLHAEDAKIHMQLSNVHFIYANMTQVKFREFDHFYFYNSFYENIDMEDPIDDTIATSYSLYNYYTSYLFNELDKKPAGTRLVTFHTTGEEVPPSYRLADLDYNTLLKMWIKK